MNLFDIVVCIIVGFCLVRGGFSGIIREASGIIGLIAGFYGANTYYLQLLPYTEQWIDTPGLRKMLCFFLLFIGILMIVGLLARLIRTVLHLVFLGWVDRTFGICFGAVKGILIATLLFIFMAAFMPGSARLLNGSRTAPYLAQTADAVAIFVSRGIKADFNQQLEGMKKEWKL